MPTIGEQLKQTREARKLTIKQVVQSTHLRAHYLQAMEKDDFSAMPSIAQARGFLRLYAEFLGLDAGILIETLHPSKIVPKPVETADQPTIHPAEHKPAIVLP
ncbi:MAG: helix-turn-helix transcriptional regulator, partial [Panacibacter sp.]